MYLTPKIFFWKKSEKNGVQQTAQTFPNIFATRISNASPRIFSQALLPPIAPAAEQVAGSRGSRSERERHRPPRLQAETGAASCWNGACRTGSSPSSVRLMPSSPAAAAGRKLVLQLAALLSTRVCSWPGSLRMAALLHLGGAARTAAHGTAAPATQSGRSSRSL